MKWSILSFLLHVSERPTASTLTLHGSGSEDFVFEKLDKDSSSTQDKNFWSSYLLNDLPQYTVGPEEPLSVRLTLSIVFVYHID